jgi:hypothetical protein
MMRSILRRVSKKPVFKKFGKSFERRFSSFGGRQKTLIHYENLMRRNYLALEYALNKDAGFSPLVSRREFEQGLSEINEQRKRLEKKQADGKLDICDRNFWSIPSEAIPLNLSRLLSPWLMNQSVTYEKELIIHIPANMKYTYEFLQNVVKPSMRDAGRNVSFTTDIKRIKDIEHEIDVLGKLKIVSSSLMLTSSSSSFDVERLAKDYAGNNIFDRVIFLGPTGLQPTIVHGNISKEMLLVAAENVVLRSTINSGQYHESSKHVWIHESIFDQFVNMVMERIDKTPLSDYALDLESIYKDIKMVDHFNSTCEKIEQLGLDNIRRLSGGTISFASSKSNDFAILPRVYVIENEEVDLNKTQFELTGINGPLLILQKYKSVNILNNRVNNSKNNTIIVQYGAAPAESKNSNV